VFTAFTLPDAESNRVIQEFFISLDTPIALSCWILYRSGEHLQLANKDIDPLSYNTAYAFRDDFAAISFLRKAPFLKTGVNLGAVAISTFLDAEECCKVTNRRFRNLNSDPLYTGDLAVLHEAVRRKICQTLGRFSVDSALDLGSWGPGVTRTCKGKDTSASRKFREENGITIKAYRLWVPLAKRAFPSWFSEEFLSKLVVFEGNEVITVPKNAKTDRTIGIEPGMNSYFQLGIGRTIRRRLRMAGFDLNSDQANRLGALTGSSDADTVTGLATIDFSSASDLISSEVVRSLLPDDWHYALDSVRSPCYEHLGVITPYAKFSAMGNGYTFELESLIFVSLAVAVCDALGLTSTSVSVFGDDIILPCGAVALYVEACAFFGFKVNTKKSHWASPFRESCGSYYFDGHDVKPIFLKEVVSNAKSVYRLANSIRLLSHRRATFDGCDSRLRPVWKYLVRRLPASLREYGPLSAGDACLAGNFDEAVPKIPGRGWEGFIHSGYVEEPIRVEDENPSQILARLRYPSSGLTLRMLNKHLRESPEKDIGSSGAGNLVPLRAVTRIRFKTRMFVLRWYNLGAWRQV